MWILKTPHTAYAEKVGEVAAASETAPNKAGENKPKENRSFMTTNVAAVRVPTPNADTAANARTEGRGLQNPERGFTLTLSNFEGPFDLLLTLISRRKLDITEVALAEVTDEFLAYLHALYAEGTERALDEASEFLVTAATLLELKTARLLPQHREPLEEDVALLEARDLLFARLLQYRAYREVADIFAERWAQEAQRFPRAVALEERFAQALPELVFTGGAEEFARIAAAALSRTPKDPEPEPEEIVEELNEHLHVPLTTIAAEEHYILHSLLDTAARELSFAELVQGSGELEIAVVRFLALLELYKEGALHVEQDAPLGAIRVRASASAAQFVIREESTDTAGTQDAHETSEAPEPPEANGSEANTGPVKEDYE